MRRCSHAITKSKPTMSLPATGGDDEELKRSVVISLISKVTRGGRY
jgi:hypothetical protein